MVHRLRGLSNQLLNQEIIVVKIVILVAVEGCVSLVK